MEQELIIVSYACVAIEVVIFAFNGSLIVALILIAFLALTCDISYPSAVAMGQSFVPHHLGMASGLSFGVMVCIGGLMTPVFWPHRRLFWTSGRHALCYRNCPFGNHYHPFHPKEQTDEISVSVYRSEILNLRDTANLSP